MKREVPDQMASPSRSILLGCCSARLIAGISLRFLSRSGANSLASPGLARCFTLQFKIDFDFFEKMKRRAALARI